MTTTATSSRTAWVDMRYALHEAAHAVTAEAVRPFSMVAACMDGWPPGYEPDIERPFGVSASCVFREDSLATDQLGLVLGAAWAGEKLQGFQPRYVSGDHWQLTEVLGIPEAVVPDYIGRAADIVQSRKRQVQTVALALVRLRLLDGWTIRTLMGAAGAP